MKKAFFSFNNKALLLLVLSVLITYSCNEDKFLEVPPTDRLSTATFPTSAREIDFLLTDLYGRLRNSTYNTGGFFPQVLSVISHEYDIGWTDAGFTIPATNTYTSSDGTVEGLWNSLYENISKCNAVIETIENYISANPSSLELISIKQQEGQARFLRSIYYFQLIAHYGDSFIYSSADREKPGVPLYTKPIKNLDGLYQARATVGEVWDFIILDLEKAEILLEGRTYSGGSAGRAGIWAVKAMLGRYYLYTKQYAKSRDKLKEVIEKSGKTLVDYNAYRDMYSGQNEFNNESLFEVNFNNSPLNTWSNSEQTRSFMHEWTGAAVMDESRGRDKTGRVNYFPHDRLVERFGYKFSKINQSKSAGGLLTSSEKFKPDAEVRVILDEYLTHAKAVRADKSVDPRLWVVAYQPFQDTVSDQGRRRVVIKHSELKGNDLDYAWGTRKYNMLDQRSNSSDGTKAEDANIFVIRYADVLLMYAESLIGAPNSENPLEYINMVKRRAYGYPIATASPVDYTSLSSATSATDPVLANDPLKYERFAEFALEGTWWYDVVRWRIGESEAAYFKTTNAGNNIGWRDASYRLPIPNKEILNNKLLVQNSGY